MVKLTNTLSGRAIVEMLAVDSYVEVVDGGVSSRQPVPVPRLIEEAIKALVEYAEEMGWRVETGDEDGCPREFEGVVEVSERDESEDDGCGDMTGDGWCECGCPLDEHGQCASWLSGVPCESLVGPLDA